jgi:hypothetical protein
MAAKKVKTKKPNGGSISRSGYGFTFSWKITDKDYGDGQSCQYRVKVNSTWGKWVNIKLSKPKTDTKASITLTASSYYPQKAGAYLKAVEFRVRGNRKKYTKKDKDYSPTVSDWYEKTYNISNPAKPSAPSVSRSDSQSNVCTFSWSAKDNDKAWAVGTLYESILVSSNESNGAKLTWNSSQRGWLTGTAGLSGSRTITEDTTTLASGSWVRWIRVKTRGVSGDSAGVAADWVYARHVYGMSYQVKNKSVKAQAQTGGGYVATATWEAPTDLLHPVDKTTVQYTIVTPLTGLRCPTDASWTDANVSADTSGNDSAKFMVPTSVGLDKVLFVRVNTEHNGVTTYGAPMRATLGALSDPTGLSVSTDSTTYRASISATNNSAVPDSFMVITYISDKTPGGRIIGIMPHGHTGATVQCPAWEAGEQIAFGVYAAQGNFNSTDRADGVGSYAVNVNMRSATVVEGGSVPVAPAGVTLAATNTPGTIRVTFEWAWRDATSAEISWADHEDAWESTDEPSTYVINNTHSSRWNISGLETGVKWYVRVRLISGSGEDATYGAYSDIESIDLSSAPAVPVLALSDGVITEDGSVTASWSYSSTDGTLQAYAELAEVVNGEYVPLAHTETAQNVTISAAEAGWAAGESHDLVVRVVSGSGKFSDGWSDPVRVVVAEPLTVAIASDSLEPQTIVVGSVSRNINALNEMPLTITTSGAGEGSTTTIIIERAETYHIDRPDESELYGFEGETVAIVTNEGDGTVIINRDDLIGRLDDGAKYRIIVTAQDGLGQSAQVEKEFEVHWTHQALVPTASVEIDSDAMIAKLTPIAPSGTATGDTCDIYRLSVDKPVLIYPNALFGTVYVDPFPTIGEYGGHRFVYKTMDGDYITEDNTLAWVDTDEDDGDRLDTVANIIDFAGGRVELIYEIDLSNSWTKDFTETQYLGGAVQGDWNPAVTRSTSVSAVGITADDQDTIQAMRRLAEHPGICHIRTKDGSSFAADVQVTENYKQSNDQKLVYFSLKITRVDSESYDGMTLSEWNETQQEEA